MPDIEIELVDVQPPRLRRGWHDLIIRLENEHGSEQELCLCQPARGGIVRWDGLGMLVMHQLVAADRALKEVLDA